MVYTYETALAEITRELGIEYLDVRVCTNATAAKSQKHMVDECPSPSLKERLRNRFQKYRSEEGYSGVTGFGFADQQSRAAVIYLNTDRLALLARDNATESFLIGHEFSHIFRQLSVPPTQLEEAYPSLLSENPNVYEFPNTLEETRADLFGWFFELAIGNNMTREQIQKMHCNSSSNPYAARVLARETEEIIQKIANQVSKGTASFTAAFIEISEVVFAHAEELEDWYKFHRTYFSANPRERDTMAYQAGHIDSLLHLYPNFNPDNLEPISLFRPNPFYPKTEDHLRLQNTFFQAALDQAIGDSSASPFFEFAKMQNLDILLNLNLTGWCADRLIRAAELWNETNGDVEKVTGIPDNPTGLVEKLQSSILEADGDHELFFNVGFESPHIRYGVMRNHFLAACNPSDLLHSICSSLPDEMPEDVERRLLETKSYIIQ